ncbi:MAG: glycosyltransferase family 25 protein, partial [Thiotrichaceae bacterium]
PDRWRYVSEHFSKFGLNNKVKRFSAVDVRDDPELQGHEKLLQDNFSLLAMCGCMLSHRTIIENAKSTGLKNILVFEDDIRILPENISGLRKSLKDLENSDWDVFYLGATYRWSLERVGSYLVRVPNGAYATHAIAYNHTVYDQVLDLLPSNSMEYIESSDLEINALDKWLQSDFFNHAKFFGTNPIMVVQGLQESDIAFKQKGGIDQRQISLFEENID